MMNGFSLSPFLPAYMHRNKCWRTMHDMITNAFLTSIIIIIIILHVSPNPHANAESIIIDKMTTACHATYCNTVLVKVWMSKLKCIIHWGKLTVSIGSRHIIMYTDAKDRSSGSYSGTGEITMSLECCTW